MATIVNNPPPAGGHGHEYADSGLGFFIGILVVILLGVLFFVYALPNVRNNSGTNINVPDRINPAPPFSRVLNLS